MGSNSLPVLCTSGEDRGRRWTEVTFTFKKLADVKTTAAGDGGGGITVWDEGKCQCA